MLAGCASLLPPYTFQLAQRVATPIAYALRELTLSRHERRCFLAAVCSPPFFSRWACGRRACDGLPGFALLRGPLPLLRPCLRIAGAGLSSRRLHAGSKPSIVSIANSCFSKRRMSRSRPSSSRLANGRLPFFSATPTPTVAPTATLAPTATPAPSLTIFTDADHVFQIGYPTGWLASAKNDPGPQPRLAIFSNPAKQANFNVGTLPTTDTPAQGVVEQTLAVLAQKTGIAHRSGPTTVIVGGQAWTQEAGDVTVIQNGTPTPMHAIALATIHGNHTIYILELAPVDSFAMVDPVFQQMLQSFEFLS